MKRAREHKPKPCCRGNKRKQPAYQNSQTWRRLSKEFLYEHPLCERCGSASEHSHHRCSRAECPDRIFDKTNLEALCKGCHTKEENARKRE